MQNRNANLLICLAIAVAFAGNCCHGGQSEPPPLPQVPAARSAGDPPGNDTQPPQGDVAGTCSESANPHSPPPPQARRQRGTGPRLVFRDRIEPQWFADDSKFWYRNDLPGGTQEFVVVDAVRGTRELAFNHEALAAALDADSLGALSSIEAIELDASGKLSAVLSQSKRFLWDAAAGTLQEVAPSLGEAPPSSRPESEDRPRRWRGRNREDSESPDGKWKISRDQFNLVLHANEGDETVALSTDGQEGFAYGPVSWSPDSRTIVAFRVKQAERGLVHLVRSSPPDGGRAELQSRPYPLPGDTFPTYELNVFHVDSHQQIKPAIDPFEHEWLQPRVRFSSDGRYCRYQQTDRGHQRFRVVEVDLQTGVVRNIIDERSDTFIWTAHTENLDLELVNWLEQSAEIIHVSEKNGWRQLILIDALTGEEKRELTPRGIVVRGIEFIDEENRKVCFKASGRAGQDPYFVHFGWVDLDTGKLTWITQADGDHSLQFSPDRKFAIDRYSRVDRGPVHELRNTQDGSLLCQLEQADLGALEATGWKPPEVFVAKGRDGETDIWGIIVRPANFDPTRRYPVIEDIYAGPQDSFVPKGFSPFNRYEELTSLGFVVVKIDGMGTANRSKAFHDVCWKNLKDGGFQDRILWMQAAAEKYPQLDLSRVGIYGVSAGGQNAAAAVLFHPEFYRVAVAACGCHDNRMDKASWNEQWMGYPLGPHYSECSNIDNAHRLEGKLLLIVGEMDDNVPPESTMRFADALIRADKDFDLLVVPNAGHGMGGAYGARRMRDYFVQHLLGIEEDPVVTRHDPPPLPLAASHSAGADATVQVSSQAISKAYLFTSFRGNGEDGLRLAFSTDAYHWHDLPGTFLKPSVGPSGLLRDPSAVRGPDGTFHLVWTTGWKGDLGFGYASTQDFLSWSDQRFIPAMAHEPATVNVWAPELYFDEDEQQFIILWASTIPGRFAENGEPRDNNQRMYYTTTRDFREFAPTKLFLDPGFNVIDCFIVRREQDYALILKDNSREVFNLRTAPGPTPLGPWGELSPPFTEAFTEGPAVVRLEDAWLIYYDVYRKGVYGAMKTTDFRQFTDVTAEMTFPAGHKHGTVVEVTPAELANLIRAATGRLENVQLPSWENWDASQVVAWMVRQQAEFKETP
jgi:dipeptidyl aminopeptidase/acylaminoacyl peptidase